MSNIAFGIWTNEGWAVDKLPPQLKTWISLLPEVNIFMREFKDSTIQKLEEVTKSNVIVHILPITNKTVFENSTENFGVCEEQMRLMSIKEMYERYKDKDLFFFCDDNTYVFPELIYKSAFPWNVKTKKIYGVPYSVPISMGRYFMENGLNKGFVSWPSGVIFTNPIAKDIAERAMEWAKKYDITRVPVDIRTAAAIDTEIGNVNQYIVSFNGIINVNSPYKEYSDSIQYGEFPIAMPKITYRTELDDTLTSRLWYSHITKIGDKEVHWSAYSLQRILLPDESGFVNFSFGFAFFRRSLKHNSCHAKSAPVPNDKKHPTSYSQNFTCDYHAVYDCDNDENDVVLKWYNKRHYVFSIKCPKPVEINATKKFVLINNYTNY